MFRNVLTFVFIIVLFLPASYVCLRKNTEKLSIRNWCRVLWWREHCISTLFACRLYIGFLKCFCLFLLCNFLKSLMNKDDDMDERLVLNYSVATHREEREPRMTPSKGGGWYLMIVQIFFADEFTRTLDNLGKAERVQVVMVSVVWWQKGHHFWGKKRLTPSVTMAPGDTNLLLGWHPLYGVTRDGLPLSFPPSDTTVSEIVESHTQFLNVV